MKEINLNEDIKEELEKEHLCYPFIKYNKKWGLRKSSKFENYSLKECLLNYLRYLYEKNILNFDEGIYFDILENKRGFIYMGVKYE